MQNYEDILPKNCYIASWDYSRSGSPWNKETLGSIEIVLLLPEDRYHLDNHQDIRMEYYVQAEMVMDAFKDVTMWRQPRIEVFGELQAIEARMTLFVVSLPGELARSGSRGLTANEVTFERVFVGSNPTLSA